MYIHQPRPYRSKVNPWGFGLCLHASGYSLTQKESAGHQGGYSRDPPCFQSILIQSNELLEKKHWPSHKLSNRVLQKVPKKLNILHGSNKTVRTHPFDPRSLENMSNFPHPIISYPSLEKKNKKAQGGSAKNKHLKSSCRSAKTSSESTSTVNCLRLGVCFS